MKCIVKHLAQIAALFFFFSPSAHSGDVCDDIASVVKHSRDRFAEWRGRYDRDLQEYTSTFRLPTAKKCTIQLDDSSEDSEYQCRWGFSSQKKLDEAYQGLIKDIKDCSLGDKKPHKHVRQFPDDERRNLVFKDNEYTYLKYRKYETDVDITISVRRFLLHDKKSGADEYLLDIEIERMYY